MFEGMTPSPFYQKPDPRLAKLFDSTTSFDGSNPPRMEDDADIVAIPRETLEGWYHELHNLGGPHRKSSDFNDRMYDLRDEIYSYLE